MHRLILTAAVVLVLVDAAPLSAQFAGGPLFPFGGRGVPGPIGPGIGPGPRRLALWMYSPRVFVVPTAGLPFAPGPLGAVPVVVASPPTIQIVIPPPMVAAGDVPGAPERAGPQARDDDVPPRLNPDDHIVIRPRKKEIPLLPPPEPAPLAPKPKPELPPVRRPGVPDPLPDRKAMIVDMADPDPVKETARLVKLGKDAFEAGEYGAAGEQFARAAAAAPRNATPLFLKAQVGFATGRYGDAVAAIRAGLEIDRTWPGSGFDPKEVYGTSSARFAEHLAALRTALAAAPGDGSLDFLLGYELWFIGEKVEAKKWFDLAEKHLPGPGPADLFK